MERLAQAKRAAQSLFYFYDLYSFGEPDLFSPVAAYHGAPWLDQYQFSEFFLGWVYTHNEKSSWLGFEPMFSQLRAQ